MQLVQILLTAASLSAAAGGTWGLEQVMERYARAPAMSAEALAAELRRAEEQAEEAGAA
ncbi:MAG: hypothetical protein ACK4K7_13045 [Allosphingosinicella sp.]|uniref:hypothetical protein n=1 Tax=Allosphingosinicella sp. TaxID=2823234 RepID=UPI0039598AA7